MKLLFLRGQVPQDRSPKEIMHDSIESEDDVWTHLAHLLGDERCEVVYWGKDRNVQYSDTCNVRWVKNLKKYTCSFTPDVIWARGGFKEYRTVLKRYPKAFKIYYGSGIRFRPTDRIDYDLILCDSKRQLDKVGEKGRLWIKPAAPMFKPMRGKKKYDVCYVGDARYPFRAKIKGISLAYSVPKDLKMLHLGWSGKHKAPKNVKVKRVLRWDVPKQLAKCRSVIVPYTSYDSAPRIIPEALACGVPVVVLDSCQIWREKYPVEVSSKRLFWDFVKLAAINGDKNVAEYYRKNLSLPVAVEHLRGLIGKG